MHTIIYIFIYSYTYTNPILYIYTNLLYSIHPIHIPGNVFFVQAPTLYLYYSYHAKLRSLRKNPQQALTQSELNAYHVGPPMYMSYRYAQILAIFFVTLTFDTGMPILNFIAAINYLVFYCLEKYFFIRLYRAPYR